VLARTFWVNRVERSHDGLGGPGVADSHARRPSARTAQEPGAGSLLLMMRRRTSGSERTLTS
jgi:hypothetical protein